MNKIKQLEIEHTVWKTLEFEWRMLARSAGNRGDTEVMNRRNIKADEYLEFVTKIEKQIQNIK